MITYYKNTNDYILRRLSKQRLDILLDGEWVCVTDEWCIYPKYDGVALTSYYKMKRGLCKLSKENALLELI